MRSNLDGSGCAMMMSGWTLPSEALAMNEPPEVLRLRRKGTAFPVIMRAKPRKQSGSRFALRNAQKRRRISAASKRQKTRSFRQNYYKIPLVLSPL